MHSGIVLAVQADNPEDAVHEVELFNEHNAPWSDWNEHGGRWGDEIPNAVLRYTDNPTLFMEIVEKFYGYTTKTVKELLDDLNGLTIKELVTEQRYQFPNPAPVGANETDEERDKRVHEMLAVYRAGRLLDIVAGRFTSDQHFYDIEYGTTTDGQLKERIKENPEKQFLVVWDYHH